MSFATNYVEQWNRIISDWFQDKESLRPLLDEKESLSIDHIPEPFYGNMEECSIVIINMNPGMGLCDQCWSNQDQQGLFVNDVKNINSYSTYVKDFPLLPNQNKGFPKGPKPSIDWWKSRYAWINRILSHKGIKCTNKKPFAIELVPLHSKSFDVKPVKYVAAHPNLDLFKAIEYAINASDAKMGLAIGKPIYTVLTRNGGYNDVCGKLQPNTKKKRYYQVIENEEKTHRILCTWSASSNKAPSKDFDSYEESLINEFF